MGFSRSTSDAFSLPMSAARPLDSVYYDRDTNVNKISRRIMSCLDRLNEELSSSSSSGGDSDWTAPPVGILPLGTGNDLARCLGWGKGYRSWGHMRSYKMLQEVAGASVALLDRWNLSFRPSDFGSTVAADDAPAGEEIAVGENKNENNTGGLTTPRDVDCTRRAMNNYLGIGVRCFEAP